MKLVLNSSRNILCVTSIDTTGVLFIVRKVAFSAQ